MKNCFDLSYGQSLQKIVEHTGSRLSLIHITLFHKQMDCYCKMLCLMTSLTVI